MKKKFMKVLCMVVALAAISPISVLAEDVQQGEECLASVDQESFENLIAEIQAIKLVHPEFTEEKVLETMNNLHGEVKNNEQERGVTDIWNALTDSEKNLCIRYPFDALKVNSTRKIATQQTERKFGYNGLGDRSDAFRHGIWNAEMTILIGSKKAELFATAHEDKDTTGLETDGHPKEEHKKMDLHNNGIGRSIGQAHLNYTEEQMADCIYDTIYQENTDFIWLNN